MTKTQLRNYTNKLISEAVKGIRKNMEKAIASGSMNIQEAEDNYILPRSLLIALLNEEINQFDCSGTCYEKQVKKEAKNIYAMI